jgi:hypothetical protein
LISFIKIFGNRLVTTTQVYQSIEIIMIVHEIQPSLKYRKMQANTKKSVAITDFNVKEIRYRVNYGDC